MIAKTVAEIDQLKAKYEDLRYELINTLDSLTKEAAINKQILHEYTLTYKEVLELRDHRDELFNRIDELIDERDQLKVKLILAIREAEWSKE